MLDFKFKNILLLFSILLLAFTLRFWNLASYPALNADEAAIGYNAYSLLETGKDEHGNPWPIHFESFGDYKPGLYFYLILPFIKFFGLNEWSVRVPNALLGVGTVFLIYLLAKELFKDRKLPKSFDVLPLISALFLAISPWHIHFSRGGWEVNVATFFIILGLWLFLKGLNNVVFLILSSLTLVLSFYTYHAARVIVPLLVSGLAVIYRDSIKKNIKNFALAGLIGLVAILPLVKDLTRPEISSRAAGVGIFSDTGPLARINEQRGEHKDFAKSSAKIFHNKLVNYGLAFAENWAEHFHGEFLFLSGDDIQRNKVPETGQLYIFDMVWLLVGILWLVRNQSKSTKFVLLWLVIAPTASALTFQSPHALRAQNMIIPLTLISALGLTETIHFIRKFRLVGYIKYLTYLFIGLVIVWNFARYEHMYWTHMTKEYPFSSQYGVKELTSFISEDINKFEKIVVTDRYDQPYILFLFYLKYPPQRFQNDHQLTSRDKFGFSTVTGFDKFEFKNITWDSDKLIYPRSLMVGTEGEIPREANIIKKIYGSNNYLYFVAVAN